MKAPGNLSREAKEIWQKIQDEYQIEDKAGLTILNTAMEAYQTMKDAQKIIGVDGLTVKDKFGQVKAHPLCSVLRDNRAQFLQGLKHLNLDIEPLKEIGRPSGGGK